jgi:hypothetical protein
MTTPPDPERPRASRRDTLAVWLRLYAAPRGVEVPPLPVRKIAVVSGVVLAVLVAVIVLFAAPAIDRSKDRAHRRDAAAQSALARRERRRVVAEQRARVVTAPPHGAASSRAARIALLDGARHAIAADARARARAGRLQGPVSAVRCSPLPAGTTVRPELRPELRFGSYSCVAVTASIARSRLNDAGELGYPFRLAVDFRARRFGWCMVALPPGEGSASAPRDVTAPPAACTEPRVLAARGRS